MGDITYQAGEKIRFINAAHNEVDMAIGFVYKLPLLPTPIGHVALILQRAETLIASARLLMDRAAPAEDVRRVQHYGISLLAEGHGILEMIKTGQISLYPAAKVDDQANPGNAPQIFQADSSSGVDAFYDYIQISPLTPPAPYGTRPWWGPGIKE